MGTGEPNRCNRNRSNSHAVLVHLSNQEGDAGTRPEQMIAKNLPDGACSHHEDVRMIVHRCHQLGQSRRSTQVPVEHARGRDAAACVGGGIQNGLGTGVLPLKPIPQPLRVTTRAMKRSKSVDRVVAPVRVE